MHCDAAMLADRYADPEVGIKRAADRLYEMYERIVFDWSSFRRQ
jgi:hypothetical protein